MIKIMMEAFYWNSEGNALFNQMENAFPDELRTNMRSILQAMLKLSDDGTLMGCMENIIFTYNVIPSRCLQ